jgi:hypothetical protein
VASKYPDEGRPARDEGDSAPRLPFRLGGEGPAGPTEARPELRDRETYYAELRFAVHCQSRSIPKTSRTPQPMTACFGDTWT